MKSDIIDSSDSSLEKSTRSSALVMACTLISRLLGFARIAVITAVYGAGAKADIINLTFSIPNNLRKLLAEGALSSAFIPELSRALHNTDDSDSSRREAPELVRRILSFQVLVIVPLCGLAILFARPLIMYVLSEFDDPAQIATATRLFRLFINYLLLVSVSAVLMGVLNAHHRFFTPAFAPILHSVSVIAAIALLNRRLDTYAVALGVLVGGMLQLLWQYPKFRGLRYDFRPNFSFRDPAFRRVMKLWLPVLATSSLFTITYQVAMRFASGLGEGSVTSLHIAITFFQLPFGIFSASVTTVLFPRMSKQVAAGDEAGLRESLQYGLRFLLVLLIPSTIFLSVVSAGCISVAFQRGNFSIERTLETAKVLVAYSSGLFFVGAFTFMQRLFYALNRHQVPFRIAIFVAVVDIGLSLWLKETSLATSGIALANSISFAAGSFLLYVKCRSSLGRIDGRKLALTAVKTLTAVIPATAALFILRSFVGAWWIHGSSFYSVMFLLIEILVFCSIVLAIYRFTNVEMLSMLKLRRSMSDK